MSLSIQLTNPIRMLLLAVAIISLAPLALAAPKRVLLVYQDDGYSPATLELQQGILAHLRAQLGQDTQFFSEQLEATRIPESQDQALAWVRTRYASLAIDVVIFIGSAPLDILPGVPTVYAGTTRLQSLRPSRDMTRRPRSGSKSISRRQFQQRSGSNPGQRMS
jgi:hypothetical protein